MLAGVMGNAFTLLFTPNVIAAGASTSLFGLFAAVVILGYYSHSPLLNQLGRNYLALIVINLIFNLFTPSVGITGHLGGLVGGALAAIFLANKVESRLFSRGWRSTASFNLYFTIADSSRVYLFFKSYEKTIECHVRWILY